MLAESTRDGAVVELLRAANNLRDRSFRPHSRLIYLAPSKRSGAPAADTPTRVQGLFSAWCTTRDFGSVVALVERSAGDTLSWDIVHEDRMSTDVVAPTGAHATVSRRPLRSHFVKYKRAHKRLEITTDCLEAATPLARIFGTVLFGDPRSFLDEPALELWMLQERGPASLEVPELASKISVGAIGGIWLSGKGHKMEPRGSDLFKALRRYKIAIEGGRLALLTLRGKVHAKDGAPPQSDAALLPPHLCTVSEPEHEEIFDEFFDLAKITAPEPRRRDFFSMQPFIDSGANWTVAETASGFASLVALGILKANPENRAVTPPEHPHAGPTATAYPLGGGKFIAWSPDPTVAPFVVDEKDLVVYALQFGRLAAVIASALGLEAPAAKLDEDGVLYCGRRQLGPTFVLVFLATRPLRPATVERLRDAAGHGHAVLIVPEGRKEGRGLHEIAMPKLAGPWQPLLAEIARVLKLESFVEPSWLAPPDARFVLHRATQRVWLDGVACAVTDRHFRLLEIFIQHEGKELHTKDIAEHVAGGYAHGDTTRKQIESLVAAIEKSFKAAKKKAPKDLRALIAMPRHGHYVLHAKGCVV